jgi:hypothetical protein
VADILPIKAQWLIMMFTREGVPCGKSFIVHSHTFIGAVQIAAKRQDVYMAEKVTIERLKPTA